MDARVSSVCVGAAIRWLIRLAVTRGGVHHRLFDHACRWVRIECHRAGAGSMGAIGHYLGSILQGRDPLVESCPLVGWLCSLDCIAAFAAHPQKSWGD